MESTAKRPRRGSTKLTLCICGMAGSGKSTAAKRIARKYGLHYYSGGDALKELALETGLKGGETGWWESEEGMRFLKKRAHDLSFDKKVDEKLLKRAEKGNVVLDSWAMPWLLPEGFKVWLEASHEERAHRAARRDGITVERAQAALKEKDACTREIFRRLYGFSLGEDFSPFDLILDVDQLGPDEVFRALVQVIDRLVLASP